MKLTKEEVLSFLPHRDPFLFIDSVENITIPSSAVLEKNADGPYDLKDLLEGKVIAKFKVLPSMAILAGHFPGNPIVPGVVQVEMMAQASCFLIRKAMKDIHKFRMDVALLGADNSRFRRPVVPGMDLTIESICKKSRGNILGYDCQITTDGKQVAESSILANVKFIRIAE